MQPISLTSFTSPRSPPIYQIITILETSLINLAKDPGGQFITSKYNHNGCCIYLILCVQIFLSFIATIFNYKDR